MAKLIRCKQGHVFDAEKHAACPICGEEVILTPSDDGGTGEHQTVPPPPPGRTNPRIIIGAAALLAAAAVTGYFMWRPRTEATPPEKAGASAPAERKAELAPVEKQNPSPAPAAEPPSPAAATPSPAKPEAQSPAPATRPAETPPPTRTPTPAALTVVDPATVGEWEITVKSTRWVLRIEPDGSYASHPEPLGAARPDSGVFSAEAGHWAMRGNNGYRDEGTYSVTASGEFIAKGRVNSGTWHRVADAPKSILGQIDRRTVGDWEIPMGSGRWRWLIKPDSTFEFHSEANDGVKPLAGFFSSMNGRWSFRASDGFTDGGIYSFPTPDAFVVTGHLGTGAWHRVP